MTEVTQFHNFAHIFISLVGAILLLAIYFNIRKHYRHILEEGDSFKRVDKGLLFLSFSLFVWVIAGLWAFLGYRFVFTDDLLYQIGENLLSITNNMFLLFAMSYFYYAPSFIYKNEKNVRIILGIIITVTLLTLLISNFVPIGDESLILNFSALPDLLLSGFLSYLLAISFYKTFFYRGLKTVAVIAVIIIALLFGSQLPEMFVLLEDEFYNNLIKIIAKSSLISLFLLLATSWVIELSSTPKINEIQIVFDDWSLLKLNIPSKNIKNATIDFGSKTTQFKNLLKFAIRRKYGSGDFQCMQVGSGGEIKNQTYLSRIIENTNSILDQSEDQSLDRKDLFTFVGNGMYRLRILPEHIVIEDRLLQEFLQSSDNQAYRTIVTV
ncbi:MAG: hypothetical protein V3V14_11720 [Saprospiraceae bacterium]